MDLLIQLAAEPGRTVDKESLLRSVWPDAVVADGGLSHCVSELRAAFGDDHRKPRFIETVPRRGYRLIAPVEPLDGSAIRPPPGAAKPHPALDRGGARSRWPTSVVLALTALAAAGVLLHDRTVTRAGGLEPREDRHVQRVRTGPRTVVLGFANLSGDPDADWLGDAVPYLLGSELTAASQLSVVPWDVRASLEEHFPAGEVAVPSAAVLRWLRGNLAAEVVVSGHLTLLARDGAEHPRIEVTATDAEDGTPLATVEATGRRDRLAELGTRLAQRLAAELDEGALEVAASLPAGGTRGDPSWLEDYFRGRRALTSFDGASAREHLERAAAAGESPWPHLTLANLRTLTGHQDLLAADADAALALAERLSGEDRLWLEARSHALAERWTPATERLLALRLLSPDDLEYGLRLAASYLAAGRAEAAKTTVEEVLARSPFAQDEPRWHYLAGEIELARGRYAEAETVAGRAADLARASDLPALEGQALHLRARAHKAAGRDREALESLIWARRRFAAADDLPNEAVTCNRLADWWIRADDDARAREAAVTALALGRQVGDHVEEAEALRLLGFLAWKAGRRADGENALRQALEIVRHAGARAEQAGVLRTLARAVELFTGESPRPHLEQALAVYRELGDRAEIGWTLYRLGRASLLERNLEGALGELAEAERMADALAPDQRGRLLLLLGHGRLWAGELYDARTAIEAAGAVYREAGDATRLAITLEHLAVIRMLEADLDTALHHQRESLRLLEESGEAARLAHARQGLARILLEAGELDAAEELARQAVEETRAMAGDQQIRQLAIDTLARVELATGRAAEALATLEDLPRGALDEMSFNALSGTITRARALAGAGETQRARELLDRLAAQLADRGPRLLQLDLELARLGLARGREDDTDQTQVERLARQARGRGLMLLASKAEALL